MAAQIIAIADALVDRLNNAPGWSQSFTAVRKYLPEYKLEDMATLHVTVVPRATTNENIDRQRNEYLPQVDVAIQKRVDLSSNTAPDAMMQLVDEFVSVLNESPFTYADGRLIQIDNVPIFVPEHLHEWGQFTSVLTCTFRVAA